MADKVKDESFFRIYGKIKEGDSTTVAEVVANSTPEALDRLTQVYKIDWREWYGIRVHRMPEGELTASHGWSNGEHWPAAPSKKPRISAAEVVKKVEDNKVVELRPRTPLTSNVPVVIGPAPAVSGIRTIEPPDPKDGKKMLGRIYGGIIIREG
jgi:hypothetical protein